VIKLNNLSSNVSSVKHKGIALITVMLIVSLCAIIAAQMTTRLHMQMQRSTNISFNQQAYWYAMGAEAFAKRVLLTTVKEDPDVINLSQIWAQGETSYPVEYGSITGKITDLQSCLNLNALRSQDTITSSTGSASKNSPAREVLENLLIALELEDVGQFEAESMADSLKDWLDEDSQITSAGGAEDDDYASREFPYLAANNFLASVHELRIIEHFNANIINVLKPYVCVIPQIDMHKININTISDEHPELIKALLGVSLEDALAILSARPAEGFENVADFFALKEVSAAGIKDWQKDQFVVDSDYFMLKTTASFNSSFYKMNSLIEIYDNKEAQVITRSVGYY
jgi:general secretion pathway protein K